MDHMTPQWHILLQIRSFHTGVMALPDLVAYILNPNIGESVAGGSLQGWRQLGLRSMFQASAMAM